MKAALILFAMLALTTSALAYNADAVLASKEPAITVAEASAQIVASRKGCKQPLTKVWFHIKKGEVVNNHAVLDDDSVFFDEVCPNTPEVKK
jgi:hypothetical protein